jgi:hypothetical protein
MKGTDIGTPEMESAAKFLELVSGNAWPIDAERISIPREKLIRLIAWYGEIRAKGGDHPGIPARVEERRLA